MSEHVFTESTHEKQIAALTAALRDIRDMKFSPESMTGPVVTLKSLARAALEGTR